MSTSDIKYKYALSKSGEVVCIDSLTEKDRDDYECLGCENVLRPVLPNKRKKHFRHKLQQACSTETYLHRMGKELFIKKYNECLRINNPYIIELETSVFCDSCQYGRCFNSKKIYFDLTAGFKSIKEEKRDRNLIPDILIETESGEKIYIEIYVTHPSSGEKIFSGNKIIEFEIQKEEDLEIFQKDKLDISLNKIKIYNFNLQPEEIQLQDSCQKFYLHRRSKELFVEKYNDCLTFNDPYTIELEVPVYCNSCQYGLCHKNPQRKLYDLAGNFKFIKIEQRGKHLIPDIIIENELGEKIYIEISNKNISSKRKNSSKEMVIEFEVEKESDLKIFKSNSIVTPDREMFFYNLNCYNKIKIYNFNLQPEEIQLQDSCQKFYLHKRSKELFVKKYDDCLTFNDPYTIELEVPVYCNSCQHGHCLRNPQGEDYNLTANFSLIKVEQRDKYLIPDIIIETKSGEKIYIEISIDHYFSKRIFLSEDKTIEFIIQKNDDLDIFNKNKISMLDRNLRFYNFNPKPKYLPLKESCDKTINYFMVLSSGKCAILTCPMYKWDMIKKSKNYTIEIKEKNSDVFIREAKKAFYAGVKIKNCFLCSHRTRNELYSKAGERSPVYCELYQKIKNSNFAADCKKYHPDAKNI